MNAVVADAVPRLTMADRWRAFKRRRMLAFWVALGVLVAGVATTVLWPPTYRSTGTILIEQQELPSDLVRSTISSYADERIQVISQRVMTTDNLLRIIQRYDLYPKLRERKPREELLERMHKDIRFQMISADVMDPRQGHATKADIAFTVSYDSGAPEVSARVANELVSLYLDENLKNRRQLSADAAAFLNEEAQKLKKSIDVLQSKIARFKDQHINALPDQSLFDNQELTRTQEEQRDVETQLRALDQQITYLDAQLAQISPTSQVYTSTGERVLSPNDRLKYLRTEYARLSGIYAPDHPDVVRIKREMDSLERSVGEVDSTNDLRRELDEARMQLAGLRERYAPDYPDVLRLQRQIDTLTGQLNAAAAHQPVVPPPSAQPDNPAYIQVKAQREADAAQRESLKQKLEEIDARAGQLERRLAEMPGVERDYSGLLRELESEQIKYREVQQKQLDANLAENLEDEQKGERFTLIDPPLVPQKPVSPNRILLLVLSLVLAPVGGLAAVALREGSDPSVRGARELQLLLEVAPLAVIPELLTSEELRRQRRQRVYAAAGLVGGFAVALLLIHLFYRPLDVIWAVALRKLDL